VQSRRSQPVKTLQADRPIREFDLPGIDDVPGAKSSVQLTLQSI